MTLSPQEILSIKLDKNDADAETIGQYLFSLTRKVWQEEEDFDGKRPFGNSGWTDDIVHALILNGVLRGELDEYGRIDDYDRLELNILMGDLFSFLYNADYTTLVLPPAPKDHILVAVGPSFTAENNIIYDYEDKLLSKDEALSIAAERNEDLGREDWYVFHVAQ